MNTEPKSRPYHHGDLRQALLEAACDHLRVDGADTLSLRALARTIGVSQTAPYRHFDSRNALFAAIAVWGFQILGREMSDNLKETEGSVIDHMVEMGLIYLAFSENHFEKYRLFFDSSMVDYEEYEELQLAGERCFEILLSVIRRGQEEGIFRQQPEEQLAGIVWSGLHGIASLLQTKGTDETREEKPVRKAVYFLADERREVLTRMLDAITVS